MNLSDFVSHLEELRKRLLICLIVFVIATITCYCFSHQLLEFLTLPLQRFNQNELFFNKPYEAFLIHLKVASFVGFLISTPVLFTQGWLFVTPGLYQKERRLIAPLVLISIILFILGAVFAFDVAIPVGLHFLLSFQTEVLKPLLGVGAYFSFLIGMVVAFGILFDFPVVLLGLVRVGVLERETLAKARRPIIVGIFVMAAILTPSPDPISQLLLATPLLLLFELSLLAARFIKSDSKSL